MDSILVQPEFRPEVNPFDVLVGGQGLRRAAPENRAVMDDIGTVGDLERFPDVVSSRESQWLFFRGRQSRDVVTASGDSRKGLSAGETWRGHKGPGISGAPRARQ